MLQTFAKNSLEYQKKLKLKIKKLKEIIQHINRIKLVTDKYEIILQEQNAKIKRIMYIEKPNFFEDLHQYQR